MRVEVRHEDVVFGELAANDAFGAGPGGKVFVADVAHHAVVKAELGLVIGGLAEAGAFLNALCRGRGAGEGRGER